VLVRHARALRVVTIATGVILSPLYIGCPFVWAAIVWALQRLELSVRQAPRGLPGAAKQALEVDADRLCLDGPGGLRLLRRDAVENGWIEPSPSGFAATIRFSSGAMLFVEQDTFARAAAVIEAVGLGPRRRVLRVRLGTQAAAAGNGPIMHLLAPWLVTMGCLSLASMFSVAVLSLSGWSLLGLILMCIPLGLGYRFAQYVTPARCDIGSDGIATSHLGERRFVPLASVTQVNRSRSGVVLSLRDGKDVLLPTASPNGSGVGLRDAIVWRIEAEREQRARDEATDRYEALARANRPLKQWRADLVDRASQGASTYRQTDFDTEELVRVIENGGAPLDRRLGAAFLLGVRPVEAAVRTRVALAADAVANQHARVALSSALDRDPAEPAIEAALAADEVAQKAQKS
jgi:hypothetical protein